MFWYQHCVVGVRRVSLSVTFQHHWPNNHFLTNWNDEVSSHHLLNSSGKGINFVISDRVENFSTHELFFSCDLLDFFMFSFCLLGVSGLFNVPSHRATTEKTLCFLQTAGIKCLMPRISSLLFPPFSSFTHSCHETWLRWFFGDFFLLFLCCLSPKTTLHFNLKDFWFHFGCSKIPSTWSFITDLSSFEIVS